MATFRIHEDQENLGVELRRNHKDKQNASKLTKRTALGDMNKKFTRIPMLSNKLTKNVSRPLLFFQFLTILLGINQRL